MGFPSPAADYVEEALTVTKLCRMDANSRVIKTDSGYAILDMSLRPQQGDAVLITADGESIEGEALDDVEVCGVLTHNIIHLQRDNIPVI